METSKQNKQTSEQDRRGKLPYGKSPNNTHRYHPLQKVTFNSTVPPPSEWAVLVTHFQKTGDRKRKK